MNKVKAWLKKVWNDILESLEDLRGKKPTPEPVILTVKRKKSKRK